MIQPNELRLGNYVQDNSWHVVAKITAITESYIKYEDLDGRKYSSSVSKDYLQPIELTNEWLVRLGANKGRLREYRFVDQPILLAECSTLKGQWFVYVSFSGRFESLHKIQYVHQLQNLFFALTGEELKLNEKQ